MASTTFRTRSASETSSSVDRNASTSWCGRCRTNPTVSVRVTLAPVGVTARRTVGSSVAKSASSTRTPAFVSRLSRLDLPAFVYPAIATLGTALRRRESRFVTRDVRMCAMSRRSLAIRVRIRRRSSSILRLARAAGSDTRAAGDPATRLPGHRLTPPPQPREQVVQLGELDLGLALRALGMLGEDVEDQGGPVDDLDLDDVLQAAALRRAQLAVADDRVGADRRHDAAQVLSLAAAEPGGRVRRLPALQDAVEHDAPRRLGQGREFAQGVLRVVGVPPVHNPTSTTSLEPQLPVLDLGDVLELRGQPGDTPQGLPVGEVELLAVRVGVRGGVGQDPAVRPLPVSGDCSVPGEDAPDRRMHVGLVDVGGGLGARGRSGPAGVLPGVVARGAEGVAFISLQTSRPTPGRSIEIPRADARPVAADLFTT